MASFYTLLTQLDQINLDKDRYAITSSGSMAIRGIREARDIDVIVTPDYWQELIAKYPVKKMPSCDAICLNEAVEILGNFQTSSIYSQIEQINQADVIDGHRYVNLEMVKVFKQMTRREKDLRDIELIDEYLSNHKN